MSTAQTEAEIREEKDRRMGRDLGELHFLLWKELVALHFLWRQYRSLFADTQAKFDLMNATAPQFFVRLNDLMWHEVLLHVCRLTDPPDSVGKPNLTILQLAQKVGDPNLKAEVERLAAEAKQTSDFARDWRNRRLARRDLDRAKAPQAHPLRPASRAHVEKALASLRAIANRIELHYQASETPYENVVGGAGGVDALLYFLKLGLEADQATKTRRRGSKPE